MIRQLTNSAAWVAAALLLLTGAASAQDGAIEINHSCAVAGCHVSDSAFYPVNIGVPGSYVLTGDLHPPANDTAITVVADDVTIDLNGFRIDGGSGGCTGDGPTISCPAGTGRGIDATGRARVSVRNGIIRDFREECIVLGDEGQVHGVNVTGCSDSGISVGADSQVRESIITLNGGHGVVGTGQLQATDNVSAGNGIHGIRGTGNLRASGNVAVNSGSFGISANNQAVIQGNVASFNELGGIETIDRSQIESNVATQNPSGPGIHSEDDTVIEGNTASNNGAAVPSHGIDCRFRCNIVGNAAGSNFDDGIHMGGSGSANYNATGANIDDGIECNALSANSCSILGNTSVDNLNGAGLFFSAAGAVVGVYKANTMDNNNGGLSEVSPAGLDPGLQNTCGGTVPCP